MLVPQFILQLLFPPPAINKRVENLSWTSCGSLASAGRGEQLLQPWGGRSDCPPVPRGQGGQPAKVQAIWLLPPHLDTASKWPPPQLSLEAVQIHLR
jgi:hypothetical protein